MPHLGTVLTDTVPFGHGVRWYNCHLDLVLIDTFAIWARCMVVQLPFSYRDD